MGLNIDTQKLLQSTVYAKLIPFEKVKTEIVISNLYGPRYPLQFAPNPNFLNFVAHFMYLKRN